MKNIFKYLFCIMIVCVLIINCKNSSEDEIYTVKFAILTKTGEWNTEDTVIQVADKHYIPLMQYKNVTIPDVILTNNSSRLYDIPVGKYSMGKMYSFSGNFIGNKGGSVIPEEKITDTMVTGDIVFIPIYTEKTIPVGSYRYNVNIKTLNSDGTWKDNILIIKNNETISEESINTIINNSLLNDITMINDNEINKPINAGKYSSGKTYVFTNSFIDNINNTYITKNNIITMPVVSNIIFTPVYEEK